MGESDIEGLNLGKWLRGEERGLGFEYKVDESREGDVGEWTRGRGELGNGGGLLCLDKEVDDVDKYLQVWEDGHMWFVETY